MQIIFPFTTNNECRLALTLDFSVTTNFICHISCYTTLSEVTFSAKSHFVNAFENDSDHYCFLCFFFKYMILIIWE